MTKIAIINDQHFGIRNDLQVMFEHQRKFHDIFFDTLEKQNIKTVIHAGDLWDRRKYISFVTLNKTREIFLEPLKRYVDTGGNVHIIPGNHDIRYRNTLMVNSLTETLGGYPFNIHLKPTEISIDKKRILLVPWICEENEKECLDAINNTKALVCFGHFHINGFEMHRGSIASDGMDPSIFDRFDFVGSGHFHHRSVHRNIHYLGAPYQFTWSDYNDPRGFTILDLDNLKPEFVDNPFDIFQVYHYNDETGDISEDDFSSFKNCYVRINIQKKTNSYVFDKVLTNIQKAGPIRISIVDENTNSIGEIETDIMDEIEDTPTILSKYVDNISIGERTPIIKKILNELYTEALTLETIE